MGDYLIIFKNNPSIIVVEVEVTALDNEVLEIHTKDGISYFNINEIVSATIIKEVQIK